MSRNYVQYAWAAILAALVASCDSPVEPIGVQILSPVGRVNETVAPETPLEFKATVVNASPNATFVWREGSDVVCAGNPCSATRPIGDHTVTLEVTDGGRKATFPGNFTIRPNGGSFENFLPLEGTKYVQDQDIVCGGRRVLDPPRNFDFETSWRVGDLAAECNGNGSEQKLVQGAPAVPVTSLLKPGEHTLTRQDKAKSHDFTITKSVKLVILPRPSYLVFTLVTGNGSRDFWLLNVVDKSLTRITSDGTPKYWQRMSPDGTKLAYQVRNGSCASNLVLASADSSAAKELTKPDADGVCRTPRVVEAPYFSPDGKTIAFMGGWYGELPVRPSLVGLDGSNPRFVGSAQGVNYVVFHPNGDELIYGYREVVSENPLKTRRVFVRGHPTIIQERRLFVDAVFEDAAALEPMVYDISADGEWVALTTPFTAKRVILVRVDGSGEYRFITPAGRNSNSPSFCGSASGEEVVYYLDWNSPNAFRRVKKDGTGDEMFAILDGVIETPNCWRPSK